MRFGQFGGQRVASFGAKSAHMKLGYSITAILVEFNRHSYREPVEARQILFREREVHACFVILHVASANFGADHNDMSSSFRANAPSDGRL